MNTDTLSPEHRDPALALIYEAIADVNLLLPAGQELVPDADASLAKPDGPLDSLGLVNLIVAVEGKVQTAWGRPAGLMAALEIPAEASPFRTVETLRRFLLEEAGPENAGESRTTRGERE